MSLLSASVLLALLSCTATNGFYVNKKYNSTEDWSIVRHIHLSAPLVVKSNGSLVHVLDARDDDHALQFESLDFPRCKLALELTYPSRYPRRAVSLASGKLVVWLWNYRISTFDHKAEWQVVVVEPRDCSYRGFEIRDVEPSPIDVIDVVGYKDSFDLFITSLADDQPRNTYVYRYDDEGRSVSSVLNSVIPDLDSHPFYRPKTIRVHAVKEHDPSQGYFYVQLKPESSTSVVKRLDHNFRIIASTTLKHYRYRDFDFGSYSTDYGNFTVCRRSNEKKRQLHCTFFDGLLKKQSSVTLNHEDQEDRAKIMHVSVKNLADGGALVVFAKKVNYRVGTPVYLQRIYPDTSASEPELFGKIFCEILEVESFRIKDNEYCVAVVCDEFVHTRCVEIK